jgi:hypothetical protein
MIAGGWPTMGLIVVIGLSISGRAIAAYGGSDLALAIVEGEGPPTLIFAERAIQRSWGPSDDSIYVVHDIPDWRSEGLAMAMSAVVPGTGQMYAGQKFRGLWFMVVEAAAWTARQVYRTRAHDLRDDAAVFAGDPSDSTSAWSFRRWSRATGGDPKDLQTLYTGDREVFYDLIGSDDRASAGWADPSDGRTYFGALREQSDTRLHYAHYTEVVLWLNHVVAAYDALRAARLHNMPLRGQLELKLKSSWRDHGPALAASIERKF